MINNDALEEMVSVIQDGHINFLIGSGLSSPYLSTLGTIEKLLTELECKDADKKVKKIIEVSIKKKFFDDVVLKNSDILSGDVNAEKVLINYEEFLSFLIKILLKRKSTLIGKQINLFTSNYDIFLEKAIERLNVDFNDGFNGRFKPLFSTSNFNKIFLKKSLQYDNRSELPYFNLLKIHGSLTWSLNMVNDRVEFSDLNNIKGIAEKSIKITNAIDVKNDCNSIEDIFKLVDKDAEFSNEMEEFLKSYQSLAIVNPTKAKFRETLLDKNYYDLLRIFSNKLEKESSVLFVMGFSMADKHVAQIIIRAIDSNPTLMVYIVAYDDDAQEAIEKNINRSDLKYKKIKYLAPTEKMKKDGKKFSLDIINEQIFSEIFNKIKQGTEK